jgi:hypothetical protein
VALGACFSNEVFVFDSWRPAATVTSNKISKSFEAVFFSALFRSSKLRNQCCRAEALKEPHGFSGAGAGAVLQTLLQY